MNVLSIVIPCYNEEKNLKQCVENVLKIKEDSLSLEIIIVDDASSDSSLDIAKKLAAENKEIRVLTHSRNQGKGAALRTGFKTATGDVVAVQDADLEYDPFDLKKLIQPILNQKADVVFGSRFVSGEMHRILYFWHYMGNRFLTFLSNAFTDLNLTDMETCYKVFKREVIQSFEIEENRFGFEPEIVAKIAHMRLRIFESGISYHGRTYSEGKKIGVRDGLRALYCIFRYNASHAPLPVQFFFYLFIGGTAAAVNLLVFLLLFHFFKMSPLTAAPAAFTIAAAVNYFLCIKLMFRHQVKWKSTMEIFLFAFVVVLVCLLDSALTTFFLSVSLSPWMAKLGATGIGLFFNFAGRRFLVFPESTSGAWRS